MWIQKNQLQQIILAIELNSLNIMCIFNCRRFTSDVLLTASDGWMSVKLGWSRIIGWKEYQKGCIDEGGPHNAGLH